MNKFGALVTGSSRGLGRAIAISLMERGYFVFGISRGESTIDSPDGYMHFTADIGLPNDINDVFRKISQVKIPLGVVVNNAAITYSSLSSFAKFSEIEEVIQTNLLGSYLVCQKSLNLMVRSGFGRIINISSINLRLGSLGSSIYNASKAGLEALATPLVREFPSVDITINNLGLSLVRETGMINSLPLNVIQAKKDSLIKPNELEIEEIMHAIDFFCSPIAKNITGQSLYFGGV